MTVHVLKTDGDSWRDVSKGIKQFEIRADDRTPPFATDDVAVLVCLDPGPGFGGFLVRRISYVYRGKHVPEGLCVLGLRDYLPGDEARAEMALQKTAVSS